MTSKMILVLTNYLLSYLIELKKKKKTQAAHFMVTELVFLTQLNLLVY